MTPGGGSAPAGEPTGQVVPIRQEADIIEARHRGRALGEQVGLSSMDLTMVATAISEVARNILNYAGEGEVVLRRIDRDGEVGLEIVARDRGPGIADVDRALSDGYSTGRGLGLGLPGARRLMDTLAVDSGRGTGTTVTMVKWAHPAGGEGAR